jgi:protein-tyrosine phosphatase
VLNLRHIEGKFYLSGGWVDVPKDVLWLKTNRFRAILDLQFSPSDYSQKSHHYISEILQEAGIEYLALPMNDGETPNLENLYEVAANQLAAWDEKYNKRGEKILVKCGVGVSRSVSILIYYYCIRDRLTFTEARAKVRRADNYNYGGLPISIDQIFEIFLKTKFPDISSASGEIE